MRQEPQIAALAEQLKNELQSYPAGKRFLTVRTILAKYQTHRGIADGALELLEVEGLIERRPGCGIFSRMPETKAFRRVRLYCYDWPSTIITGWLKAFSLCCEAHPQWKLSVEKIPTSANFRELDVAGFDALIMILDHQSLRKKENAVWLHSLTLPVVLLDTDPGAFPFSFVGSDDPAGILEACRFLHERGHRQIAYLRSEPADMQLIEQKSFFAKVCELLGIQCLYGDIQVKYGEFSRRRCREFAENLLSNHPEGLPFSVIFCSSYDPAVELVAALREHGIRVPEDLGVMTAGPLELPSGTPAVTRIAADFNKEAELVLDGLGKIFTSRRKLFCQRIPMKIVDGGTVAAKTSTERKNQP